MSQNSMLDPSDGCRFGRCELRFSTREVVLDGAVQHLEPKAFDLLCYLIANRARVVPHNEILDVMWPRRVVSETVVARTVMKARRAIGDDEAGAPLIRNVPRVGYRFVGTVDTPGLPPTGEVPQAKAATLALLPFVALVGSVGHGWIEFGLMDLVTRQLRGAYGSRVATNSQVLAAAEHFSHIADADTMCGLLGRLLNMSYVVRVEVESGAAGFVARCYLRDTEARKTASLSVAAASIAELNSGIARAIGIEVFGVPPDNDPAGSDDDAALLSSEDFARARQALAQHRHRDALPMLEELRTRMPGVVEIELDLLSAQAEVGDPAAALTAHHLLALTRSRAGADEVSARVMRDLGIYHMRRGDLQRADGFFDAALERTNISDIEWLLSTRNLRGRNAIDQNNLVSAREHIDRSGSLLARNRNEANRFDWLFNQGLLAWRTGELVQARNFAQEAIGVADDFGLRLHGVRARKLLVNILSASGMFDSAAPAAQELFDMAIGVSARQAFNAAVVACDLWRELRRPDRIEQVLLSANALRVDANPVEAGARLLINAQLAHARREFSVAADLILELMAWCERTGRQRIPHPGWPVAALWLLQAGRTSEAQALIDIRLFGTRAPRDADTECGVRILRAAVAHGAGDRALARRLLLQAAVDAPRGTFRAYACLDGAWLHAEIGETEVATDLLDEARDWAEQHPIGIVVQARVAYARADVERARAWHRRFMEMAGPRSAEVFVRLDEAFANGAAIEPWHTLPTLT